MSDDDGAFFEDVSAMFSAVSESEVGSGDEVIE
jgi:hypothetical protein